MRFCLLKEQSKHVPQLNTWLGRLNYSKKVGSALRLKIPFFTSKHKLREMTEKELAPSLSEADNKHTQKVKNRDPLSELASALMRIQWSLIKMFNWTP